MGLDRLAGIMVLQHLPELARPMRGTLETSR